jgi:type IV secretory pathway VirB10-like protein
MAKTNQDSLLAVNTDKSTFAVPRNLLFVIMFLLIALVVVVFAIQAAMGPPPRPQVSLKPEAITNAQPGVEVIDAIAAEQTESGKKIVPPSKPAQDNLPPVPTPFPEVGAKGHVDLPDPASAQARAATMESDAVARELLIRNSPIMALSDNGMDSVKSLVKGTADERTEGATEKLVQDGLKSFMGAQNPLMQGSSKAQAEKDWTKANATLTSGHEVSRGYAPSSKYVLMQGSVINAVLRTAVNTDLPGELQARVTMDVYDSVAGRSLLIPKGSTLIGVYNSEVRIGQDRVNMAFKRLILPNGISVDLPGNTGMDSSGMSGVEGSVNNHYGQMFLVSTLTAVGAYVTGRSQPQAGGGTVVNTGPAQNAAGQIFVDMNKAVIDRNKAMEPTITIPSGVRFLINVARDIELPPYSTKL